MVEGDGFEDDFLQLFKEGECEGCGWVKCDLVHVEVVSVGEFRVRIVVGETLFFLVDITELVFIFFFRMQPGLRWWV